jgi:hypothetical protein
MVSPLSCSNASWQLKPGFVIPFFSCFYPWECLPPLIDITLFLSLSWVLRIRLPLYLSGTILDLEKHYLVYLNAWFISAFYFLTGKDLGWSQSSASVSAETTWWSSSVLGFFPYGTWTAKSYKSCYSCMYCCVFALYCFLVLA